MTLFCCAIFSYLEGFYLAVVEGPRGAVPIPNLATSMGLPLPSHQAKKLSHHNSTSTRNLHHQLTIHDVSPTLCFAPSASSPIEDSIAFPLRTMLCPSHHSTSQASVKPYFSPTRFLARLLCNLEVCKPKALGPFPAGSLRWHS